MDRAVDHDVPTLRQGFNTCGCRIIARARGLIIARVATDYDTPRGRIDPKGHMAGDMARGHSRDDNFASEPDFGRRFRGFMCVTLKMLDRKQLHL